MTMETVGVRAVIQDLAAYLAGGKSMEAQNKAIVAASQQVETASQKLQGTWTKEQQLAQNLANAQAKLADAEKNASQATDNHSNIMGGAIKAVTGLVSAYAGYEGVKSAIDFTTTLGGETFKLMNITGLTAEATSSLIFAAEKQGVTYDQLSAGLRIFSKNMLVVQEANDGFAGGAKTTKEVLESMGIQVLDTSGKLKPMGDLLNSVADFFQKDSDATEKAGLAAQLFSRGGAALLPVLNLGAKGLSDAAAMAQKLGVQLDLTSVMSIHNFILAQNDAKAAIGGLELELGQKLLPQLTAAANWLVDHQQDFAKFFGKAEDDLVSFVGEAIKDFDTIKNTLSWLPDNSGPIVAAIGLIGIAMVEAWGPKSLAAIGLIAIIEGIKGLKSGSILGINIANPDVTTQSGGAAPRGTTAQDLINVGVPKELATEGAKKIADAYAAADYAAAKAAASVKTQADATDGLSKVADNAAKVQAALKDGIISFAEAEKLGIDAATAGRAEGIDAIKRAEDVGKQNAYDYASTIQAVTTAMQSSAMAGQTLQLELANKALTSEKSALTSVFSGPTVEVATLQIALDKVKEANLALIPSLEADKQAHTDAAAAIKTAGEAQAAAMDITNQKVAQAFSDAGAAIDKMTADVTNATANLTTQISSGIGADGAKLSDVNKKALQAQADGLAQNARDLAARKAQNSADASASASAASIAKAEAAAALKLQVDAETAVANADDKQLKSMAAVEKGISDQIAIYQAQSQIWKDTAILADKTLLTQENQRQFSEILTGQISITSGQVRTLSDTLGISLNPTVDEAGRLFKISNDAMAIYANTQLPALATATQSTASIMISAGNDISRFFDNNFAKPGSSTGGNTGTGGGIIGGGSMKPKGFALGGFTSSLGPELVQVHPNEVILPMNNPSRSREILASMPTSSFTSMVGRGQAVGDINVSVSGETLDTVYAAARATMDKAFREAASTSGRAGALLQNTLG